MTNDLSRRLEEHRSKVASGFTQKYNVGKLVYVAIADTAEVAIAEEKRLKGGSRAKKIALIESQNPEWKDLSSSL